MTRWPMRVLALLLCLLRAGSAALPAPAGTRLREEGSGRGRPAWDGGGREREEAAAAMRESTKRIRLLNSSSKDNTTAVYGINQFSHLFPEEFKAIYLRSIPHKLPRYIKVPKGKEKPLPKKFDWRDKKVIAQVRNQQTCGGCWAFSVVGGIESAYAIKRNTLEELSVQQVIDCSYNNYGCNGGSTVSALSWLNQTKVKLVRDSEYTFKAQTGLCHYFDRSDFGVSITGFAAYDFSGQEEEMMRMLVSWGPLAVTVDAISWQDYLGGIIQYHCSSGRANHAVLITGFDRTGSIPYWIVQNSWGPTWGIDGYVHVKIGSNICGMLEKIRLCLIKKLLPHLEDRRRYHEEFVSSTSFHGVHNIVHMQSKARRVLWLLIVAGCLATVIWQICSRFIYYFSWPTTSTVVVQYVENIKFPSVTFCNLNRFQAHAVSNLKVIFLVWNIVSAIFKKFAMEDKYSQELNDFLLGNQNFSIKEFTRKNGFYLNSSTLLECDFFGKPCYPQDFEHIFTEYGNCFTFNHNDLSARRVSLSGRGLHLIFDVQQDKFTDEPTLGYTDAGITFIIHSPQELPRFDGLGLLTPVGMHARVAIRQLKSIIQEYPWGECKPDIKLQYHKIYSTNGCLLECKARYIQDWCGCLPFILPGNGTECDLLKFYKCVYPAVYDIEIKGLCTVGTHNSTCPAPCEETDYPTTVTYSNLGGEKAIKYFSTKLKKSPEYIRQNLVRIEIKYHDLSYKITQQQKALTVSELLSEVGGQLGLFCGASMITIIELLEYIFTNFCWMCIFLLLKAPEMPQWNNPSQNQPTHTEKKRGIQEC